MGRIIRVLEGRFGRLVLTDLAPEDRLESASCPSVVLQQGGDEVLFLNPGDIHVALGATRLLAFHAALEWLQASFPAVFGAQISESSDKPLQYFKIICF